MCACNNHNLADKRGYTLIELAVAVAVLALAIFGVAELFSRSISAVRRAENITKAVSLAQAQVETTLATKYEILTVGIYEPRHNVFEMFSRETSVDFINPLNFSPQQTDTGLKRITINIFYPSPLGEKTLTLSTLKADQ